MSGRKHIPRRFESTGAPIGRNTLVFIFAGVVHGCLEIHNVEQSTLHASETSYCSSDMGLLAISTMSCSHRKVVGVRFVVRPYECT